MLSQAALTMAVRMEDQLPPGPCDEWKDAARKLQVAVQQSLALMANVQVTLAGDAGGMTYVGPTDVWVAPEQDLDIQDLVVALADLSSAAPLRPPMDAGRGWWTSLGNSEVRLLADVGGVAAQEPLLSSLPGATLGASAGTALRWRTETAGVQAALDASGRMAAPLGGDGAPWAEGGLETSWDLGRQSIVGMSGAGSAMHQRDVLPRWGESAGPILGTFQGTQFQATLDYHRFSALTLSLGGMGSFERRVDGQDGLLDAAYGRVGPLARAYWFVLPETALVLRGRALQTLRAGQSVLADGWTTEVEGGLSGQITARWAADVFIGHAADLHAAGTTEAPSLSNLHIPIAMAELRWQLADDASLSVGGRRFLDVPWDTERFIAQEVWMGSSLGEEARHGIGLHAGLRSEARSGTVTARDLMSRVQADYGLRLGSVAVGVQGGWTHLVCGETADPVDGVDVGLRVLLD